MKVNGFYFGGDGNKSQRVIRHSYDKPEPKPNEIEVKMLKTGICSTDIDMYYGRFGPLHAEIQGHEGLGRVTKSNLPGVEVGELVATRSDGAFYDHLNSRPGEFVRIPDSSSKYIIEPVACAINMVHEFDYIVQPKASWSKHSKEYNIAIRGSGFLAKIINEEFQVRNTVLPEDYNVYVNSSHFDRYWKCEFDSAFRTYKYEYFDEYSSNFDAFFDLSKEDTTDMISYVKDGDGLVCFGAPKKYVNWNLLLWKSLRLSTPSPRSTNFLEFMKISVDRMQHFYSSSLINSLWDMEVGIDNVEEFFYNTVEDPNRRFNRAYINWEK